MKSFRVQTECFAPGVGRPGFFKTKNRLLLHAFYVFVLGLLPGCVTTSKVSPLAPSPPELRFSSLYYQERAQTQPDLTRTPDDPKRPIMTPAQLIAEVKPYLNPLDKKSLEAEKEPADGCKLMHRFDRKAILAYEWGRNRVSFDADGLNFDGAGDQAFKLEYRLRLQPEKSKRERCRYNSAWQGLIGSGYNEFFIRENDTIYQEFKEYRTKMQNYLDRAF